MKNISLLMFMLVLFFHSGIYAQSPLKAIVAGKNAGKITAKELLAAEKITVANDSSWHITSYRFSAYAKNRDPTLFDSNNEMLKSEIKKVIPTLPAGTKIYFEYIKAKNHDSTSMVSPISFTLK